jgi:pyruvate,water dikinase
MSEAPLVLNFTDPRCRGVDLAGGKGASLASMTQNGLPVPPGFVITSSAFAEAVNGEKLLDCLKTRDLDGARAVVAQTELPPELQQLIKAAYEQLPQGASVAVRSSACAEDSNDASYAGQQETYLFVETFEEVLKKVVECWLSFFSERALFYREHKGDLDDIAMAVVVQQMVDADKAGVMFTVDPVNNRKDRIVVEAARGIGEHVVSGEVTPDYYTLDRKGTVKKARVVDERVLSESELAELVKVGLHLAELNGGPQDIEWAYDSGGLYMLQSRPVTTL